MSMEASASIDNAASSLALHEKILVGNLNTGEKAMYAVPFSAR